MFKSKLTNNVRLQAAIDQCEAALDGKTNSIERNLAAVQKDLSSIRRAFNQIKESGDEPEQKKVKLKKLIEKRELLKLKVQALEGEVEQFRAEVKKQNTNINQVTHERYERMRGLLAYGMGTGGLNSDAQLLFHTLGDLLEAKSEGDRASAERSVNLILAHGDAFGDKQDKTASADDEIARQFEALEGEEQTAFHRKHRDELNRAFDARNNNI